MQQIGYAQQATVEELNRVIREINRALINIPSTKAPVPTGDLQATTVVVQQNNMNTPGFQETLPLANEIGGNAATATKLQTARTINGGAFDGTANITVADDTKVPNGGVSTGANTAAFSAANKPGSAVTLTVQTWLKVTISATDYYIPLWV